MSKFGLGLVAILAACLLPAPDSTAEPRCDQVMLPGEGAVPSHAILRISSCPRVSASCFEVYLVPQGEEPQPSYRVKRVFPWYHGEKCLLMVRGWPDALTGPARVHVVIRSDGIIHHLVAPNPIRIRHPPLAVVLVVDDSYSMRRTDPERLRVHAVRLFVEMASKRPELESCALIAFSKRSRLLFGPGAPVVGQALETALQSLVAQGPTDLDGALRLADQVLDSVTADRQVVVVLSDGRDEPGSYEEAHRLFVEKNRPIYTIGLSELADSVTLRRIAAETGGRFFFAAEARSLPQIFQDIALSFDRNVCVTRWRTEEGQEKFVPVDDSVKLISFVLGQDPGATVTVGPRGERWEYRLDVDLRDTFIEFPVSAPGQWTLRALGRKSGTVTVVAKSDLEFLLFSTPVLEKESSVVQVAGVLVHGTEPLLGARCQVSLVARDDPAVVGMLHDDGQHNDGEANDGIYAGQVILPVSGSYRGAVVAKGRTSAGHEFERMVPVNCEFEQPIAVSKLPPTAFPRTEKRLAWPMQRRETGPAATELVKKPVQASPGMLTVEPMEREAAAVTQTVVITAEPKGVEETEQEETVGAMRQTHAVREVPPVESSQVASPSRRGLPLLFWLLLLGHLLLLLFWLLSRDSRHLPPMARYFALSTAIHCLLAMLVLDILVGTAPVVTERIAPQLAVQIQAVREALGLEVAVPTGAIHLPETRTVIELPSPQTRVGSDDGMIAPQVPPVPEMTALPSMSPPETEIEKQMAETVAQESKARPPLDEPTEAAREVPQKIQTVQRLERMQAITAERLSEFRAGEERRINVAELPVELSQRNLELMPLAPDTEGKMRLIAETITKNPPPREESLLESVAVSSRKVTETQVLETPQAANVGKEATESASIPMRSATQPSLKVTEKVSLIAPIAAVSSPLPLAKTDLAQAKAAGAALPRETERIEELPRTLGEQKKIVPPDTGASPRDVVVLPQVDRESETATVTHPSPDRSGSVPLLAHAQPLPSVSPKAAVEQQLRLESEHSKRRMKTDEIAEVFETTFAGMMAQKSIAQTGEVGMTTQTIEKIGLDPSKYRTGYTPSMVPHRPGVRVTARSPVIVPALGSALPVEGFPEQSLRAVAEVQSELQDESAALVVAKRTSAPERENTPATIRIEQPREVVQAGGQARTRATGLLPAVSPQQVLSPIPRVKGFDATIEPIALSGVMVSKKQPTRESATAEKAVATAKAIRTQSDFDSRGEKPRIAVVAKPDATLDSGKNGLHELARSGTALPRTLPSASAGPTLGVDLKPGLQSLERDLALSLKSKGAVPRGSIPVKLALGRYGGDWDCSRTAMMFLAHQLAERTGMMLEATDKVISLASPELVQVPFVYITGHKDFVFTDEEVRNLRAYLQNGGSLWADDSTHFGDETFDRAFRREIARVLPGCPLVRLPRDFTAYRTGYDLTKGYKGYAIPPGDKYRLDYLEGIKLGDRVAVVYSRNDYGHGLAIDANTFPLMQSLTDLSPAEMQEGSVQMGINLVLYFLSSRPGVEAEFIHRATTDLRQHKEAGETEIPAGKIRKLDVFDVSTEWGIEPWSDPSEVRPHASAMKVNFEVGEKGKVAFSRSLPAPLHVSADQALVVDAESLLSCGARLALGFAVDGIYYETRPFYLKPGRNSAVFLMGQRTFKSEASNWEYTTTPGVTFEVQKLTILIYSPMPGTIVWDKMRLIGE